MCCILIAVVIVVVYCHCIVCIVCCILIAVVIVVVYCHCIVIVLCVFLYCACYMLILIVIVFVLCVVCCCVLCIVLYCIVLYCVCVCVCVLCMYSCGNDITSSCLYTIGLCTAAAGIYAPVALILVVMMLYLFRAVYAEVCSALPLNGGAYNALLNTTTKSTASVG